MTSAPASGRIVHVNVSPGGVPKLPVAEARVGRDGLDGDAHDHDAVHGGPHRAVCLLAIEAIERVRADGHDGVGPGSVGENLTTEGIELALLPVGARLAIGGDVVLEIAGPANPCDVIKGAFVGGKSGRISILLHPTDSRMYARVERDGVVRPGDPIRVLPARLDTNAEIHHELDLLDSVERDAWLAMWCAAADSGIDVRILDKGDMAGASSPDLPGSVFNRVFGMRQVPIQRPRMEAFLREAGVRGWLVVGIDDPQVAGRQPEWPVGVHHALVEDVLERDRETGSSAIDGLAIRRVDPDNARDVARWAEIFLAGFGIEGPIADAWRRFNPFLVRSRGYQQFIGELHGRDVAASALFNRRRVAWLGAGTVLPEARGAGIQRALIADRVRRGQAAGSTKVLSTAEINTISAANLEFFGIRRIWTRGHYAVDPGERSALTAGRMRG